MTNFVYVLNQAGRDQLRDALVGCLKAEFDPERFADACADDAMVEIVDGEPEINVEVSKAHNTIGAPWTITVAGPQFFNAEPVEA